MVDGVAPAAAPASPLVPGPVVAPTPRPLDTRGHSAKVPRPGGEEDEPFGGGQEHGAGVRGGGEPALPALARPERGREGGDRAERGLERLLHDRLSQGDPDPARRQREQSPGDRLHDHQAHLVRQPVPGHVQGAQSSQHLGRGAGGEGGRGRQQRDRVDGRVHSPRAPQPPRLPGDVRGRHVHRQLALPIRGARGQLALARQGQDAQHRGGRRHDRDQDVRQLVVAREIPHQLRVRVQQRRFQLLHDHADEEHRYGRVHIQVGAGLPRRRALLLVHRDPDQLHQRRHVLQSGAGGLRGQGRLGPRRGFGHHRPGRRAVRRFLREQHHQQRHTQEPFGAVRVLAQGHPKEVHDQHTEVLQRRGAQGIGVHLPEPQVHLNGERIPYSFSSRSFPTKGEQFNDKSEITLEMRAEIQVEAEQKK